MAIECGGKAREMGKGGRVGVTQERLERWWRIGERWRWAHDLKDDNQLERVHRALLRLRKVRNHKNAMECCATDIEIYDVLIQHTVQL